MANPPKVTAFTFDASQVPPASPREPIPNAWYNCEITDAEVILTKGKAKGEALKLEFTVIEGEHAKQKFWGNYCTVNANPDTVAYAQRDISAICHATGVIVISDATVFVGKRLQVKTKTKPAQGEFEAASIPGSYKALEGASVAPGAGGPPPVPGTVPPPPVAATPPPPPAAPPTPPAPAVVAFPPAGWKQNGASDWYYEEANTANQVQEATLRAMFPAPVATPPPPVAPPQPPAPPAPPAAPEPPPVTFPPAGWLPNGDSGWFYEVANTANQKQEAELRAMFAPAAPAAPAGGPPPPPAAPTDSATPPWKKQG